MSLHLMLMSSFFLNNPSQFPSFLKTIQVYFMLVKIVAIFLYSCFKESTIHHGDKQIFKIFPFSESDDFDLAALHEEIEIPDVKNEIDILRGELSANASGSTTSNGNGPFVSF